MTKFQWNDQIPVWAQLPKTGEIIYEGAPRHYHVNRAEGQFYVGTEVKGESLECQIFAYRWEWGERWGRNPQTWLDLGFVDGDGVASVLALNKDSAINVYDFLTSLKLLNSCGVHPSSLRVTLDLERRQGEDGSYFVVAVGSWGFVTEQEFFRATQFVESREFEWIFAGEIS